MQRTRIKFCGLTRAVDVEDAVGLGVDAIGLVCYPPSKRAVTVAQVAQLGALCPPMVTVTALFVDPEPESVYAVLETGVVDLLQFHGAESPEFCQQFGRPWMKAFTMRPDLDLTTALAPYGSSRGVLLDAWHPEQVGGTGVCFDWSVIPSDLASKIVLAGGLTPENVGAAIHQLRPWAVDVSSGIEATPGLKDSTRMAAFVAAVQQKEQHNDSSI